MNSTQWQVRNEQHWFWLVPPDRDRSFPVALVHCATGCRSLCVRQVTRRPQVFSTDTWCEWRVKTLCWSGDTTLWSENLNQKYLPCVLGVASTCCMMSTAIERDTDVLYLVRTCTELDIDINYQVFNNLSFCLRWPEWRGAVPSEAPLWDSVKLRRVVIGSLLRSADFVLAVAQKLNCSTVDFVFRDFESVNVKSTLQKKWQQLLKRALLITCIEK